MDRIGFIMSMLLSFLGILLLSTGLLVQALLPKIGLMAFTIGGGSYSPDRYNLGFTFYLQQAIAIGCIIVGAALSRRFCRLDQTR